MAPRLFGLMNAKKVKLNNADSIWSGYAYPPHEGLVPRPPPPICKGHLLLQPLDTKSSNYIKVSH